MAPVNPSLDRLCDISDQAHAVPYRLAFSLVRPDETKLAARIHRIQVEEK
jgi:hypothetical protein